MIAYYLQIIDRALTGTSIALKDSHDCFNNILNVLVELTRLPDCDIPKGFEWMHYL